MSEKAPQILPLPQDVAAQLRSSTAISNLQQVVLGLLENALDAGAGKVQIGVDFRRGTCTVEDDGDGISPNEFSEHGGLGKRHWTSKNSLSAGYGKYGAFIASVAALSIITITSQHSAHISPSTLILHHSRPAARLIPAPAHQQLIFRDHGTRVTVQDLFGNMPVRVRQRGVLLAGDQKSASKDLEELKRQITALALGWHWPISITMNDTCNNVKHLIIRGRDVIEEKVFHDKAGRIAQPTLDLTLIRHILSQAGYIEPSDWSSWIKVSARTSTMHIRGAISLKPAPTKQVQFITLGHRPLFSCDGANIFLDEINRFFALSTFGNEEEEDSDGENLKIKTDKRYKQDGYTHKQLQGGSKGVDKRPMFYIRIGLEDEDDVKKLDRDGILASILKVLGAMIRGFLEDNHFRPRARLKRLREKSPAKQSKSPIRVDDIFSTWSRIKVGRTSGFVAPVSSEDCTPENISAATPKISPSKSRSGSFDLPQPAPPSTTDETAAAATDEQEHTIEWTIPVTKAKVLVNSRTGLVLFRQPVLKRLTSAPSILQSSFLSSSKRITRTGSSCLSTPQPGTWAGDLLSKWENPIFPLTEQAITQISLPGCNLDNTNLRHGRTHRCTDTDTQTVFANSSSTITSKLSKAALKQARLIAQVDKKFLLISLVSQNSKLLVLIDQHAADERIRVETLLDQLTSLPPTSLPKPLTFELHAREQKLFTKHAAHFSRWGITYSTTPSPSKDPQKRNLTITALPTPIAEKCRIDPKALIKLLRSEAWKLEDNPLPTSTPTHTPPQGILDMLNSRACRSAIMFNDVLTREECEVLVGRLAETRFPFQCAHGRPSMVPSVDLGGVGGDLGGNLDGDLGEDMGKDLGGDLGVGSIEGDLEGFGRGGFGRANASSEPVQETFGVAWKRWRGAQTGRSV